MRYVAACLWVLLTTRSFLPFGVCAAWGAYRRQIFAPLWVDESLTSLDPIMPEHTTGLFASSLLCCVLSLPFVLHALSVAHGCSRSELDTVATPRRGMAFPRGKRTIKVGLLARMCHSQCSVSGQLFAELIRAGYACTSVAPAPDSRRGVPSPRW
jgi:hypothetical protein